MEKLAQFEGKGSYQLSKNWLRLNQFRAVIIKRFHYIIRNGRGLFSQILLPALFVSIAMTVALSAPKSADAPAIVLDTSQFYNLTQPMGNFIPFAIENNQESNDSDTSLDHHDAGPQELANTFQLASGIGSKCILKSAHNSSFDFDVMKNDNMSRREMHLLLKYYTSRCSDVFVSGIHLNHYVPQVQVLMEKLQLGQLTTINTEGNYIDYNCINLQQLMQKVITVLPRSIAPRFIASLIYHQNSRLSRFPPLKIPHYTAKLSYRHPPQVFRHKSCKTNLNSPVSTAHNYLLTAVY